MTIDPDADVDTISAASDDLDSTTNLGSEDSQDDGTQDSDGDTATSAPSKTGSADDSDGSSTTVDTTLQTTEPEKDWKVEYEKAQARINDLRSGYTRKTTEHDNFRKQYDGVDAEAVRKFKAEQERAVQANLPVFNPKHPEHAVFKDTLVRYKQYKQAVSNAATPEAKEAIKEALGGTFSAKEADQIRSWEVQQQQYNELAAMDPRAAHAQLIREEAQAIFDERMDQMWKQQEEHQIANDVRSWMEAPANVPLVAKYRDRMLNCLAKGYGWEAVKELLPFWEREGGLQSRVTDVERKSATVRAQQDAIKAKASITRDPATTQVDPQSAYKKGLEYAKKHGLPWDHPRVLTYVDKVVQSSKQ